MQPIHFAHGYDWMALFFLAAPVLIPLLDRLRGPALVAAMAILLSDNLLWFASFLSPEVQRYAITLTPGERDTLAWLRQHATNRDVVAADDASINYLTSTYSAARSWHGHVHNTPQAADRKREVDALAFPSPGPNLFILRDPSRAPRGTRPVAHLGEFHIFRGNL